MATSLDPLAGPQFLGVCFNWALLGALNLQVYSYHDYFPADRRLLKCLVYGILIYEWVQTGLITAAAMNIYVYNYGDVFSLLTFHNTWFSATIMDGIISVTVQVFFALRIWRLSRSRILPGAIIVLAFVQAIACFVSGAMEKSVGVASAIRGRLLTVVIIWLSGSVLVDVMIAVTMTVLLLRSKTGIAGTDALINRMVRLVVETGTLTASLAILVLVLANVRPLHETLVYEAPALILTKMYSNTFLTNLNNRASLRRKDTSIIELIPETGLVFAPNTASEHATSRYGSSSGETGTIKVLKESYVLGGTVEHRYLKTPAVVCSEAKQTQRIRRNSIV